MSTQHDEVLGRVIAYLGETLEHPPAEPISATSHLIKDLNLDSIQSFEMVADLEDHYDVSIDLDVFQEVETVGDVTKVVAQLVEAKGA